MNVKSILAFAIGPIGAAVISLFSLPIVTWIFQPDDVGRIALFHVVVNFFVMLLTFGTDQAFIRNYHESDNKSRLFNEALLLPIICSVVLVFILVAFFDSAVSDLFQSTQQSVIYLCALALILSVLNRYLATVLRMEERGLFYSLSQVLPKVLFLLIVLSYVLFPVALDFSYLLLAHVVAFVVVTVVLVWGNFSFLCHCLSSNLFFTQ